MSLPNSRENQLPHRSRPGPSPKSEPASTVKGRPLQARPQTRPYVHRCDPLGITGVRPLYAEWRLSVKPLLGPAPPALALWRRCAVAWILAAARYSNSVSVASTTYSATSAHPSNATASPSPVTCHTDSAVSVSAPMYTGASANVS